jgi:general secretion pathway protein H
MMPISVPGPFRRGTSRGPGFTLIELLVVLLVMGLFAGLVGALARPDDRAALRVEAERVAALLELAAMESRLTGRPVAWSVLDGAAGPGYQFWRWRDDAGWYEARDDELRARQLPAGMAISDLRIEALQPADGARLEFAPEGAPAYDFRMSYGDARYAVSASPVGEVRIHEPR